MGDGALAIGPKLPRPSSTLPAFVIGQAVVVALPGELQYVGLRRPMAAA